MTSRNPANTAAKRSALMGRIRSKNTKPELAVRSLLHSWGYRFRLHRTDLPGNPDIVLPRLRLALFVHGCFWHQHPCCRLASWPKSRQDYWVPKLTRNKERDAVATAALRELGWRPEVIWECETRIPELLAARMAEVLLKVSDRLK